MSTTVIVFRVLFLLFVVFCRILSHFEVDLLRYKYLCTKVEGRFFNGY
jgi:hypothetical protein